MTPAIKNLQKTQNPKALRSNQNSSVVAGKNKISFDFIVPFFQSGDNCYALVYQKELGLRVTVCDKNFQVAVLTLDAIFSFFTPNFLCSEVSK